MKFKSLIAIIALIPAAASLAQEVNMVPVPKSLDLREGQLSIRSNVTIAASDKSLLPLANVAGQYVWELFGSKAKITQNKGASGGIVLRLDKRLKGEEYTVEVGDRAVVTGGSYKGVAWGLSTLMQSGSIKDGVVMFPHMKITDQPYAQYRGLTLDLGRKWHPIEVIKQVIVLCGWYKIGYLQLHFVDDQLWTFPSTAYPQLGIQGQRYTVQELRGLEVFATARGVSIVPEIEMPGHSGSLLRGLANVVGNDPPSGAICPGRESTYRALDTLVGEACDIFKATPYFHIGADETDTSGWTNCKYCVEYRKHHGIANEEEQYRHFIARMDGIVKKHGKRMIVWEGFRVEGKVPIPKDVIVMEFESMYELPQNLVAAGYTVINTSWQPLYIVNQRNWSPEKILSWNMYRWENWWERSRAYPNGIDVPESPLVIGAEMCAWEQPADIEISSIRQRLPAMSERVWDHKTRRTYADFAKRLEHTDAMLTELLGPTGEGR